MIIIVHCYLNAQLTFCTTADVYRSFQILGVEKVLNQSIEGQDCYRKKKCWSKSY